MTSSASRGRSAPRGGEKTIRATATETGRPLNQQVVIFAETMDGKLAHYSEFWNPLIWPKAFR